VTVGTNVGEIGLWEVGSRERLVLRNFKVWDLNACSMPLQVFFFFFFIPTALIIMCIVCWMLGVLECLKLNCLFFLDEIQAALVKDPGVSVNRVIWSPDGNLFGKLKSIIIHGWIRNTHKISGVKRLFIDFSSLSTTGVAYSRHIVQIYSYHGNDDVRQHLEVYNLN
jgi:hypothetical protein